MNPRFVEIKKQIGKFIANFSVTEEDGKTYIFDGDVIREGLDINTYDENGDVIPLPDGEYVIKGVKCNVSEGKIVELPEKDSKEEPTAAPGNPNEEPHTESIARDGKKDGETEPKDAPQDAQEATETTAERDAVIADLKAENERLKAENEAMKAELKELKETPMASPVPQRTDMSSEADTDIPDNIKGTKYERAYKLFKA